MKTKHCKKCDLTKPLDDFYETKKGSGRYRSWCAQCVMDDHNSRRKERNYDTNFYHKNSDKILDKRKTQRRITRAERLAEEREYQVALRAAGFQNEIIQRQENVKRWRLIANLLINPQETESEN